MRKTRFMFDLLGTFFGVAAVAALGAMSVVSPFTVFFGLFLSACLFRLSVRFFRARPVRRAVRRAAAPVRRTSPVRPVRAA